MLGLFSIFQPEAVKKVTLYKGSFPARYGGRVSSIVDIRTNDGNLKETHGSVSIGVVSDKFHLEGPIIKDKLSYSISARGMHTALWDPFIRLALKNQNVYGNYFFYDLTGKLSWRLSDKDRFFLGAYSGRDRLGVKEENEGEYKLGIDEDAVTYHSFDRAKVGLSWGNDVVSLRWNHIFSQKLFANTTVAFNKYRMNMSSLSTEETRKADMTERYEYDIKYNSGIRDWSGKLDFDYVPTPQHLIKFGAEYVFHTFIPETVSLITATMEYGGEPVNSKMDLSNTDSYTGHDFSVYAEDDFSIGDHLTVNPGIHATLFSTDGKNYFSVQPRVSAKLSFDPGISLKAGYGRSERMGILD